MTHNDRRLRADRLEEAPLAAADLATPGAGLEARPGPRKRVIVIGAGMAGLVAAFELARQGHDPIVLEAQGRVGGRVYTLRNFAPGLYAEAGAMRIPRVHDLTLRYCDLFGLELRPFVMGNPKGLVVVGGDRMTAEEAGLHPERLPFELAEHERGRRFDDLWAEATRDLRDMLDRDGAAAWKEIVRQYDQYSLREFLLLKGFSEGAIEMYGVMNFVESDMNNAVIEELREDLGKAFEDMQEIVGGMDRLPKGFFTHLQDRIRFGAEVHAIAQDPDSVTVHFKTEAGTARSSTPGSRERWNRASGRLARSMSWSTTAPMSAAQLPAVEVGRVPLHELGHRGTGGGPVGLITEDDAVGSPAADLGHRVDDRIVRQRTPAPGLDLPAHEVASNDVEWRGPLADANGVALPQRFEPIVVANRMPIVLGLVSDEIHTVAGSIEARESPVVIDCLVADRARRQLDVGGGRLPVRESTATTERRLASTGGCPAPKTGRLDEQGQCAAPLIISVLWSPKHARAAIGAPWPDRVIREPPVGSSTRRDHRRLSLGQPTA